LGLAQKPDTGFDPKDCRLCDGLPLFGVLVGAGVSLALADTGPNRGLKIVPCVQSAPFFSMMIFN
jgi:hypothetical protein